MLRTSALCAAVLVRREADLPGAFRQTGDYLFFEHESPGFDLIDRQVETTKATLGLKLFLSLAWEGERGLGDYVASRYDTTRRFHEVLSTVHGVTCPYEPESNILCFRGGDGDQIELRDRIVAGGALHLGTTMLGGERHLRVAVMAPATDDATLETLIDQLIAPAATSASTRVPSAIR
jgi:L-2,4-diaminobutyrate decarboxylase